MEASWGDAHDGSPHNQTPVACHLHIKMLPKPIIITRPGEQGHVALCGAVAKLLLHSAWLAGALTFGWSERFQVRIIVRTKLHHVTWVCCWGFTG